MEALISSYELSHPQGDFEQNLTGHFDEDLAFLEEGSIGRHEELFAEGHIDLQPQRCTKQLNKQGIALGRIDEDPPDCDGLDFADAGQAFGRDSTQGLEDSYELDADLHDTSKLMSNTQGWYKSPSSIAMRMPTLHPDPVAVFSGFCDSLAV